MVEIRVQAVGPTTEQLESKLVALFCNYSPKVLVWLNAYWSNVHTPIWENKIYRNRGGGVNHILAEKRGVGFTFFLKMHENAIFPLIRGGAYAGYALCWIRHCSPLPQDVFSYIAYTVFYHVLSINVVGLFNVILLRLVIYVYQQI